MAQEANIPGEEPSVHEGLPDTRGRRVSPWAWVGTVNFAQGLQYVVATQLFAVVFKTMGVDTGTIVFWVSFLTLPWTIKPLWGPLVDKYGTKRNWTIWMQLLVGLSFVGVALALQIPGSLLGFNNVPWFFWISLIFLFALAFAAATHDIACDGYYMLTLSQKQQAFFVAIRSTFFRFAMIFANGVLVLLPAMVQDATSPPPGYFRAVVNVAGTTDHLALEPLPEGESFIRATPATVTLAPDQTTTITLALTKAPEDPEGLIVLARPGKDSNIAMKAEDPAFAERITFTKDNWETGVVMVVSANKAMKESSHSDFKFTAGDIDLSWTVMAGTCAVMFLFFFFYHQWAMPIPAADAIGGGSKVPFIVPVAALAATLILPIGMGYGVYKLIDHLLRERMQLAFLGATPTPLDLKGFSFFFTSANLLVVCALGSLFLLVPFLKRPSAAFFYSMSNVSGIQFADVFVTFFQKERILLILSFILTFRLGEVQLTQIKNIFFIDSREKGGLGMSLTEMAITNSVVYAAALIVGGILSGWLVSKYGLRRILWPLIAALHLPNALFIYLAYAQPTNFWLINFCVATESFGYGIGLTAYLLIMIMAAQGPYKTAHYALCTGFMSLGVMIPGMWSGYLQELVGYEWFFILVLVSVIPGTIITAFVPIDPEFGKKAAA